jgi:hypothetical protein
MRKCLLAALVSACSALVVAGPAQADSVVYIKGGNVWLTSPDGSVQQQVTTNGSTLAYSYPSEDDHGVIAVQRFSPGTTLVRMRQDGHVLSSFDAAPDYYSGFLLNELFKPVISYDGTKIAFGYFCYCGSGSLEVRGRWRAEFTRSDQPTDPNTFGHPFDFQDPSWVTNSRALLMGTPPGQASLLDMGASSYVPWFDDPVDSGGNSGSFSEGVVSRQGDKLALVYRKNGSTTLRIYPITGNVLSGPPPPAPTTSCELPNDPAIASPSFSPDGTQLVYTDSSGVEILQIPPSFAGNCSAITVGLLVPGGSQARFSAASISQTPGPGPGPHPHLRLSVTAKSGQHVLDKKALVGRVECNLKCTVVAEGAVELPGKVFTTKPVTKVLAANRPIEIHLALTHNKLAAIRKALAHHKRVSAGVIAVATRGNQHKAAHADFRIHH